MNGLTNSLIEISLGELVFLKDVLLTVKDEAPFEDYESEIKEALEIIDSLLENMYRPGDSEND